MIRTFILPILLILSGTIHAEPESLSLTRAEETWIETHPVVRYTSAADFISDNRTYILNQITSLCGIRFERIETTDWSEAKRLVSLGEIDLITAVTNNQLDKDFFQAAAKSDTYYLSSTVAVTRKQKNSNTRPLSLDNKTIAIIGSKVLNDYLRRNLKNTILLKYENPILALDALADKRVDAVIGLSLQLHPIIKDNFHGIFEWEGIFPGMPIPYVMGITPSSPELASIINKSISSINKSRSEFTFDRLLLESDITAPTWESVLNHYSTELISIIFTIITVGLLATYSRRAQKSAQKSEADKSAFLAMMSHEIRSPMNGVMSSIELLQTTKLTAQQRELISLATISASNLLALLDDVLDASKLEAGIITLELSPTNLNKLAHNLVNIHRVSALKQYTSLSLTTSGLTNILIITSPTRLQQLISNLLSNAIKFTQYGNIILSIQFETKTSNTGDLKILVSDTGIGIDKAQQSRLFQAFVQADNSITRRYGGSGLGLSICKQLVELMDGQISLDSEPGKGTQVSLTIPVEFKHKTKATPPTSLIKQELKAAPPFATQLYILVVEDSPTNQKTIDLQLTELGYRALIVDNGYEALKITESKRDTIAIVLLDCHLPDMDGYEVARRMRQQQQSIGFAHLPIIAISASTNTEHQKRCTDSGIDGSLSKPLNLSNLRKLFELWLPPFVPSSALASAAITTPLETLSTLFIRTSLEDTANLRKALETRDLERARHYAHRLHGSALTIKAHKIATAAKRLEDILKQPVLTRDDWPVLVSTIEETLNHLASTT
ncbi:sensor protein evgS [Pseudomonas fluorescens]|nr:sensor protein evgS [Pseudomonas fluorescens]